jgi:hypothetical protein
MRIRIGKTPRLLGEEDALLGSRWPSLILALRGAMMGECSSTTHTGTATSAIPSNPRRPKDKSLQECDDKEHRDVVTAWVKWSFNEAASSLNSLPTVISIWQQAFLAIKSVTEKDIVDRDISFQNIRIDNQYKIKVCDFDMAMDLEGKSTGVKDRTGTIAFMAISKLGHEPVVHRPVHDCESIFWLCALDLLARTGTGQLRAMIGTIINPCRSISSVELAKLNTVNNIESYHRRGRRGGRE